MRQPLPNDFDEILGRPPARRRAWLFILPALLGLILLVVGVAVKQGYFVRRVPLNFYALTADGVAVGTKIKLLGFPVGAISGVNFIPASADQPRRVKLQARVDAEYLAHIPHGSVAHLVQEGVIGEYMIEIIPSEDNARPVAAGESIDLKKEGGLSGLASMVESRVMPVVDEAKVLLRNLNDERHGLKPVLAEVLALVASADTTARQMAKIAEQAEPKLGVILSDGAASLKSLRTLAETTEQRSAELLDDASATLKNLREVSAEGSTLVRQLGTAAPVLLEEGRAIAADVSEMTQGAKRRWPFRLLVDDEPTVHTLGVDTGRLPGSASEYGK